MQEGRERSKTWFGMLRFKVSPPHIAAVGSSTPPGRFHLTCTVCRSKPRMYIRGSAHFGRYTPS